MVVVLPAPFFPMKPKTLPSGTDRLRASMIFYFPKLLDKFCIVRTFIRSPPFQRQNKQSVQRARGRQQLQATWLCFQSDSVGVAECVLPPPLQERCLPIGREPAKAEFYLSVFSAGDTITPIVRNLRSKLGSLFFTLLII